MGYCKTPLYVHARLKQENTLRQAHAYTHPNLHEHRDSRKDRHVPCHISYHAETDGMKMF